jgi:prephenate dehydratase
VLVKLAEKDINLSKIQSVPRLSGEWQYMFYCDLELSKNTNSDVIQRVLRDHTSNLEILGVYYKGDMLYES